MTADILDFAAVRWSRGLPPHRLHPTRTPMCYAGWRWQGNIVTWESAGERHWGRVIGRCTTCGELFVRETPRQDVASGPGGDHLWRLPERVLRTLACSPIHQSGDLHV
jgi:hypothetical protein